MNTKAQKFQSFLDEKKIVNAFSVESLDDEFDTSLFRSQLPVNGNNFPTLLIFDKSVYTILRVLIVPKIPSPDDLNPSVLKLINDFNRRIKVFKYYVDDQGSLILDIVIVSADGDDIGEIVYAMYDFVIQHLTESYALIMKSVWG